MPMEPAAFKTTDWRQALPVLQAGAVTLRELRLADAPSLLQMLTTAGSRAVHLAPADLGRRLRALHLLDPPRAGRRPLHLLRHRAAGLEQAIGIIQVRTLAPGFDLAEWGFAIGSSFWGTGMFQAAAKEVLGVRLYGRGHPQAGSALGGRQRPRQRRAAETGGHPRSRAAQIVPARRCLSGSGDLVDLPGRLARVGTPARTSSLRNSSHPARNPRAWRLVGFRIPHRSSLVQNPGSRIPGPESPVESRVPSPQSSREPASPEARLPRPEARTRSDSRARDPANLRLRSGSP